MKFTEVFPVDDLLKDLDSMVHIPAEKNRLYDCEVVKASFDSVYLDVEFKTNENSYISLRLVADRNFEKILAIRARFGGDIPETWIGQKCKVFYENEFNVVVL